MSRSLFGKEDPLIGASCFVIIEDETEKETEKEYPSGQMMDHFSLSDAQCGGCAFYRWHRMMGVWHPAEGWCELRDEREEMRADAMVCRYWKEKEMR